MNSYNLIRQLLIEEDHQAYFFFNHIFVQQFVTTYVLVNSWLICMNSYCTFCLSPSYNYKWGGPSCLLFFLNHKYLFINLYLHFGKLAANSCEFDIL